MDPNLLFEDELAYELEIRNIVLSKGRKRALKGALAQESEGTEITPTESQHDPAKEIVTCNEKLGQIELQLGKTSTHKNLSDLLTLETRLKHLLGRLERIFTRSESIQKEKTKLVTRCKTVEAMVSTSKTALKPGISPKPTPEHSSTDSSSEDETKKKGKGAIPKIPKIDVNLINKSIEQSIHTANSLQTFVQQQENFNNQLMNMQQQMATLLSTLTSQAQNNLRITPPPPFPNPPPQINPQTHHPPPHKRISPVSKWDLQKFSGDRRFPSVNEFISMVEMFAAGDQLTNAELGQSAVHLFEGTALHWYSGLHRELNNIPVDDKWKEIKRNLRIDFLPVDYDDRLTTQIENRLQGPDEPFSVYSASMQFLFAQKAVPLQEGEKLQLIKKNMSPSYLSKLTFEEVTTLEVLKSKCREVDKTEALVKRHTKMFPVPYAEPSFQYRKPRSFTNRHVDEVEECSVQTDRSDIDDDEAVDAISPALKDEASNGRERKRVKPKKRECFNCSEEGHFFKDCPQKRKEFCQRCGCPGVKAANCQKCRNPLGN